MILLRWMPRPLAELQSSEGLSAWCCGHAEGLLCYEVGSESDSLTARQVRTRGCAQLPGRCISDCIALRMVLCMGLACFRNRFACCMLSRMGPFSIHSMPLFHGYAPQTELL